MPAPSFNSFKELAVFNIPERLMRSDFGRSYSVDPKTKRICRIGQEITVDTPWDHTVPNPELRCGVWRMLAHIGEFIPALCLCCWKVVVRPRTIQELFALRDLQYELGRFGKCGIETREWVPGLYGGYFYNRNREEGEARWKEVRAAVSDKISPDVPVILKRYCTEYEIKHGDSAAYKRPPHADDFEKLFFAMLDPTLNEPDPDIEQPWYVKLHVYKTWLQWAWKFDRKNVEKYNDGESLWTIPRTYHQEISNA